MLICGDCVNYFLECPVSNHSISFGFCELCGQKAHCFDIHIPENRKSRGTMTDKSVDSIREAIRVMYYPDIDQTEGLKLAEYTIEKLSRKSMEEFTKYVLKKEENGND